MNSSFETGAVTRIERGRAAVRIRSERAAACGGCTACKSLGGGEFLLWVHAGNLKEGDRVTVQVCTPNPWRAIGLVFALPLAVGMAGLLAGSAWSGFQQAIGLGPDPAGAVLGGGLALAAFLLARLDDRRFTRAHQPRVIADRRADP